MGTTHIHHDISEIGADIIKKALEDAGRKNFNIDAFYLGNWFTDVSQAVDPPAYSGFAETIDKYGTPVAIRIIDAIDESFVLLDKLLDGIVSGNKIQELEKDDSFIGHVAGLKNYLQKILAEEIKKAGYDVSLKDVIKEARDDIKQIRSQILNATEVLLKSGQDSKLAKAFKYLFGFIGYTKFVLSEREYSSFCTKRITLLISLPASVTN